MTLDHLFGGNQSPENGWLGETQVGPYDSVVTSAKVRWFWLFGTSVDMLAKSSAVSVWAEATTLSSEVGRACFVVKDPSNKFCDRFMS